MGNKVIRNAVLGESNTNLIKIFVSNRSARGDTRVQRSQFLDVIWLLYEYNIDHVEFIHHNYYPNRQIVLSLL